MDLAAKFEMGLEYEAFLNQYATAEQRRRWDAVFAAVALSEPQKALLRGFTREMKVFVVAGAWCGDCVEQCPIFAHFAAAAERLRIRYFDRDDHPDLADASPWRFVGLVCTPEQGIDALPGHPPEMVDGDVVRDCVDPCREPGARVEVVQRPEHSQECLLCQVLDDVAASGGYYIALPAHAIVAQPGTITGSIGVVTGKFVLKGTFDKLGLGAEAVSDGRFAEIESPLRPFTPEERPRIEEQMHATYELFLSRVAEGRKSTAAKIDPFAQGRVWTGRQALERGLVDELGGLDVAVRLAKEHAKIDAKRDVHFAITNFTSALAADLAIFNSAYNLRSFLDGMDRIIRRASAVALGDWRGRLEPRCRVIWPPVEPPPERLAAAIAARAGQVLHNPQRVVWPHRWEHDKGPAELLEIAARESEASRMSSSRSGERLCSSFMALPSS